MIRSASARCCAGPVGKNTVTNFAGLPAVSYHDMYDFDLQQEVCARAGITGRVISNPFAAEVISRSRSDPRSTSSSMVNDQIAAVVARAPRSSWGLGTLNPLDAKPDRRGRALSTGQLGFKGLLITLELARPVPRRRGRLSVLGMGRRTRQVPIFLHPPRVPIGHDQQMDQYKLDELVGRPFDTAMALARMILSGLFDRFPRLKICVAHMGGGLLPVHGAARFRLAARLRGHAGARASSAARSGPASYLRTLHVDTMGFWAPHVREAVEVFGADRVMFGTDYGPVPLDPKEHVDIVDGLAISRGGQGEDPWRNAARFFNLDAAA